MSKSGKGTIKEFSLLSGNVNLKIPEDIASDTEKVKKLSEMIECAVNKVEKRGVKIKKPLNFAFNPELRALGEYVHKNSISLGSSMLTDGILNIKGIVAYQVNKTEIEGIEKLTTPDPVRKEKVMREVGCLAIVHEMGHLLHHQNFPMQYHTQISRIFEDALDSSTSKPSMKYSESISPLPSAYAKGKLPEVIPELFTYAIAGQTLTTEMQQVFNDFGKIIP